jgi:hypothetical protein
LTSVTDADSSSSHCEREKPEEDGDNDDLLGGVFAFSEDQCICNNVCFSVSLQAAELEIEAYPLLDELTSKISTLNLERVRRLKSRLVALTRRVQKVKYSLISISLVVADHLCRQVF